MNAEDDGGALMTESFKPDWDAMAVMVEEQQRMAKRIEELEQALAQRPWVGLTDDEIFSVLGNLQAMYNSPPTGDSRVLFALAIEAKLKELNT